MDSILLTLHDDRIPLITIDGGGDGHTVVVVNGGNGFVRRFDRSSAERDARRIARLFPDGARLVIAGYDVSPAADFDLASMVRDIASIVRMQRGPVTIAGISFGGFVAARVAAEHPELVRGLILLVTAHRFSDEGRARVAQQIADLERGDLAAMVVPFVALFRRPWMNALMRAAMRFKAKRLHQRMNDPKAIATILRATTRASFGDSAWLANIRTPTLIVGGTADQFFDRSAMEETARGIAGSRLVLADRETHMLPVEQPRIVRDAIAPFLESLAS